MSAHRRPLIATALAATAVLTVAGALTQTASASPSPAAPGTSSDSQAAAMHLAPLKQPTAVKPAQDKPAPDCTAAARQPGHRMIHVVGGNPGKNQLSATATKFICGPDVPNDGYYEPTGSPRTFKLAPGAQSRLIALGDFGITQTEVPAAQLIKHADDCAHQRDVARPYNCFGGNYDITVDSAGRITRIDEAYHP
ncbi:hypothetical protein [Saccharothrix sp. ST-888]|uniref:hypothetical protein n=1 Tax=Saccharothrix sp. ST-888 TaxID=1427391 RepID=UPI0005EC2A21|nr:hypothetical protein [Saccharothrix sp. ST-888]KJK55089.1 hypothetical protein UK12_30800 [Saccharothrix sp. ST-888]